MKQTLIDFFADYDGNSNIGFDWMPYVWVRIDKKWHLV